MRFLRRSLVGLFLISFTFGLLAFAGQNIRGSLEERWSREARQRPARERIFAVNVVPFEVGAQTPILETFGEIRSRRTLDVRAPSGGQVIEVAQNFEEGGRVEAGQLLLRIDPAQALSALAVAETDVAEAKADVLDAARTLELSRDDAKASMAQAELRKQALQRQQDLLRRGVGTESAVETAALAASSAEQAVVTRRKSEAQAEARVSQTATALARREINLAEAKRKLDETELRAEFSGTLASVTLVQGGLVSNNERLASLIDATALEVSFRVSTAEYARLLNTDGELLGSAIQVVLDVSGADISTNGRVSRVSAAVSDGQIGRTIFASLEAPAGFRPGDFVTVQIEEPEVRFVAILPAAALDAAETLLLIGPEDRLEIAKVELIRRQGDSVLVRGRGLAGREVVAERSPLLGAGIKVKPLRKDASGEIAQAPEPEDIELSAEKRAAMIAFVEANKRMPAQIKERLLGQLAQDKVPAAVVKRLQDRMGG
ncbi:efflux transporter, RND family, MFP subunit [Rhodobacterales bacterium HTCC2150]|nr:efflux transporter, RND family, MFP subunit [Rhodobacterales bacterium HTCC2150] [Rhodobacteraceae bacterium HTCC2150]